MRTGLKHHVRWLVIVAFLAIATVRALAVIGVTLSSSDLYESSREIIIAEIQSVDAAARSITLRATERPKGGPTGDSLSLVFAEGVPFPEAQVHAPAVIFCGIKGSVVHLADGWLAANSPSNGSATWQVTRNDGPTLDYPGRTAPLIRLIGDLKAGRKTIVEEIEHYVFKGEIRKLADIVSPPKALAAADVNGDGMEDVLVVGAERSQLFLNQGGALIEASGEMSRAHGSWAAEGDVDGDKRIDFLVGDRLWLNGAGGFKAGPVFSPLPASKVLAASIADADGDGHADVLLAAENGEVVIFKNPGVKARPWVRSTKQLWSGGEPVTMAAFSTHWGDNGKPHLLTVRVSGPIRYALDADGGPPANHLRLAGPPPSWGGAWEATGGTVIDIDGNGLDDFYAAGPDFGVILNSRGFGTFLSNYSAKRVYAPKGLAWGQLTRATVLGSADLRGDKDDDLLVATEDGRLFAVDNFDVKANY